MKDRTVKGFALILFGILLCVGAPGLTDLIMGLGELACDIGILCGIVGLVKIFRKDPETGGE